MTKVKLTNPIIALLTIISWGVIGLLYSLLLPFINQKRNCIGGGGGAYSKYFEQCDNLIGFLLPRWIQITSEIYIQASILIGFFGALLVCLVCLLIKQRTSQPKT